MILYNMKRQLHFKQDENGIFRYDNVNEYTFDVDKRRQDLAKKINDQRRFKQKQDQAQQVFNFMNF